MFSSKVIAFDEPQPCFVPYLFIESVHQIHFRFTVCSTLVDWTTEVTQEYNLHHSHSPLKTRQMPELNVLERVVHSLSICLTLDRV